MDMHDDRRRDLIASWHGQVRVCLRTTSPCDVRPGHDHTSQPKRKNMGRGTLQMRVIDGTLNGHLSYLRLRFRRNGRVQVSGPVSRMLCIARRMCSGRCPMGTYVF